MDNQPSRIFISSDFRQNGESPARFSNILQGTLRGAQEIDLQSIVGVALIYPFKSTNNTFVINEDDGGGGFNSYSVAIPTDRTFADGDALAAQVNAILTGLGASVTLRYRDSSVTTITGVSENKFEFVHNGTDYYIDTTLLSARCLRKLGFYNLSSLGSASSALTGNVIASDNPLLLGSTKLYVATNLVAGDTLTPEQGSNTDNPGFYGDQGADRFNILTQVALNSNYGDIFFQQSTLDRIMVQPLTSSIQNVDIQLLDDDFETANLSLNSKISLEFNIVYPRRQAHAP